MCLCVGGCRKGRSSRGLNVQESIVVMIVMLIMIMIMMLMLAVLVDQVAWGQTSACSHQRVHLLGGRVSMWGLVACGSMVG